MSANTNGFHNNNNDNIGDIDNNANIKYNAGNINGANNKLCQGLKK